MQRYQIIAVTAALGLLAGCDSESGSAADQLEVDCGGKCDGLDSIESLLRDPSELDLGDLLDNGKEFANEQINDFIASGDLGGLAVEFHTRDDVDGLVRDMAAAFGEKELSTAVNALRRQHLDNSADTVYAETSFAIDKSFGKTWKLDVDGLIKGNDTATAGVGFDVGGSLEARVISAHDVEVDNPLSRLRTLREFVLPRSIDDLRALKPGESFALRGEGHLGANLGVGVPLVIAEPTSFISYSVVVSGGLRTRLGGLLDIQLVRVGGSEIVVDVGIEKIKEKSAWLGIKDRWGVQGLIESTFEIAGFDVDLGKLIDNALQSQLNDRLNLIDGHAEHTTESSRMTVARLRFDLDTADQELLEPALAQALRGDIRLAQALSNRDEPGIVAELDILRSGLSTTSAAGIDILGMSFFTKKIEEQGSIVVQTTAGTRAVLFESLHREKGWFFSSHGYTRVGLAGLLFDPLDAEQVAHGEANLVVQVEEGDKAMERDKFVDHLDGLILALGGEEALAAVEGPGNAVETLVTAECKGIKAFDPCPMRMLEDERVIALVAEGAAQLAAATASQDGEVGDLVRELGDLRLMSQSTYEIPAGLTGPSISFVVDYRVDDSALGTLTHDKTGFDLSQAMSRFIVATEIDRRDSDDDQKATKTEVQGEIQPKLDALAEIFDANSKRYRKLLEAEGAVIDTIGPVGGRTMEIRYTVDAKNRPVYAEAAARSITEARAEAVRVMFDELHEAAGGLGPHREQVVGYGLLALLGSDQVEVRFDLDMFTEDTFAHWREQYRAAGYPDSVDLFARGPSVTPIDGGLFDVEGVPVISD